MAQYWLMKSEPDEYGWDDLVAEGEGTWDGVKNAQASNNMKAMKKGDQVFFYHSRQGLDLICRSRKQCSLPHSRFRGGVSDVEAHDRAPRVGQMSGCKDCRIPMLGLPNPNRSSSPQPQLISLLMINGIVSLVHVCPCRLRMSCHVRTITS